MKNWFKKNIKLNGLYKIVVPSDYNSLQEINCIKPSFFDIQSGFIHMSYGHQAQNTIEKFFSSNEKILLIELDKRTLEQNNFTVRDEQNTPDGAFYPHIYEVNFIPKKCILTILEFSPHK